MCLLKLLCKGRSGFQAFQIWNFLILFFFWGDQFFLSARWPNWIQIQSVGINPDPEHSFWRCEVWGGECTSAWTRYLSSWIFASMWQCYNAICWIPTWYWYRICSQDKNVIFAKGGNWLDLLQKTKSDFLPNSTNADILILSPPSQPQLLAEYIVRISGNLWSQEMWLANGSNLLWGCSSTPKEQGNGPAVLRTRITLMRIGIRILACK